MTWSSVGGGELEGKRETQTEGAQHIHILFWPEGGQQQQRQQQ